MEAHHTSGPGNQYRVLKLAHGYASEKTPFYMTLYRTLYLLHLSLANLDFRNNLLHSIRDGNITKQTAQQRKPVTVLLFSVPSLNGNK